MTEERQINLEHFVPEGVESVKVASPTQQPATPEKWLDLQDCLIILGFVGVVGGIAAIHVPSALIVMGLMCGYFAWLIERAKRPPSVNSKRRKRPEKEDE